jgi:pimeloyl-ACP methyl ester carboxylesterase
MQRFAQEAVHGACDTGRYRCTYYVWGKGAPLLLIPGIADDSRSFVLMAAHLSEHFQCVAFDLPAGKSDGARLSRYTHGDLVLDTFALLDHLGIGQSYVFGSSFGSTIALELLRSQPDRLPRALLQGAFAYRPLTWAEKILVRMVRYWPGGMETLPFRKSALERSNYAHFADRPPELWQFFLERSSAHQVSAVAHRAWIVHGLDLRPILSEIRQPILLVGGDCDPVVRPEHEEVLVQGLPNARRLELLNCGHNPLFTHPEVLAEVVRHFFTPPDVAHESC